MSEPWGVYDLPDGVRFKGRTTLTAVLFDGATEQYEVRIKNAVEGFAPEEMKSDPSDESTPDLEGHTPAKTYEGADIKTIAASESIYQLDSGELLRIRFVPQQVKRYDIYNQHREPVLWVDSRQTVVLEPSFDRIEAMRDDAQRAPPRPHRKQR